MALVKYQPTSALAVSAEARRRARRWLDSPEYEASLRLRILAGTLPPGVEMMLWHYAYGKPTDQIEVTVNHVQRSELASSSDEQLQARVQAALTALQAAREREAKEQAEAAQDFEDRVRASAEAALKLRNEGQANFIPDANLVLEGEYRREEQS